MIRNLPVAAELLDLVAAAPCEPLMIWADEGGRRVLTDRQERDEASGDPMWTAYVMPRIEGQRPEIVSVRVPAAQQPVVTQFGPVALDSLEVRVTVDRAGKLAGYWSARSIRDAVQPGKRNGQTDHKPAAEHQPA